MNKELEGKVVRIDRGGPESRTGKLLSVSNDYFTLLTEKEGIIFYQAHHIKSLTQNVKQGVEFNSDFEDSYRFRAPQDFRCVLASLKNYWVKVNRGGPESIEGVLSEVLPECIVLVANEEVIRISIFHIRSISYRLNAGKNASESKNRSESGNKGESRGRGRGDSGNKGESRGRGRGDSGNRGESRGRGRGDLGNRGESRRGRGRGDSGNRWESLGRREGDSGNRGESRHHHRRNGCSRCSCNSRGQSGSGFRR